MTKGGAVPLPFLIFLTVTVSFGVIRPTRAEDHGLPPPSLAPPDRGPDDRSACQEPDCKRLPNRSKHPLPYNCRKYYECRGESRVINECPEGEVFAGGRCSPTAECQMACPTDQVDLCGLTIRCLTFAVRYVVHPNDCHLYFMCDDKGKLSLQMCPVGQLFDSSTKTCMKTTETKCLPLCNEEPLLPTIQPLPPKNVTKPTTTVPTTCQGTIECTRATNGRRYPVPGDCEHYYVCNNGVIQTMPCPPGTLFDKNRFFCVGKTMNVECQDSCQDPMIKSTPVPIATTDVDESTSVPSRETSVTSTQTGWTLPELAVDTTAVPSDPEVTEASTEGVTVEEPTAATPVVVTPTPQPASETTTSTTTSTTTTSTATTTPFRPSNTTTVKKPTQTVSIETKPVVGGKTSLYTEPSSSTKISTSPTLSPSTASTKPSQVSTISAGSSTATVKTVTPSNPSTNLWSSFTKQQQSTPTPAHTGSTKITDPEIIIEINQSEPTRIKEDDTANFSCHVILTAQTLEQVYSISRKDMEPELVWSLDNNRIGNGSRATIFTENDFVKDETITSMVTIKRMKPNDDVLKCSVYNRGSLIKYEEFDIQVLGRPRARISPRTTVVAPGDEVNVTCAVEVSPSGVSLQGLKIEWFKDFDFLNPSDDTVEEVLEPEPGTMTLKLIVTKNTEIICIARNEAGASNVARMNITVIVNKSVALFCEQETVDGILWPRTVQGGVQYKPCHSRTNASNILGDALRQCVFDKEKNAAHWAHPDYSDCVTEEFKSIELEISNIEESVGPVNEDLLKTANHLKQATNRTEPMLAGDVIIAVDAVKKMTDLRKEQQLQPAMKEFEDIINVGSNIFSNTNKETWNNLKQVGKQSKAVDMMEAVDVYTSLFGQNLDPGSNVTVQSPNIYVMLQSMPLANVKDVRFPDSTSSMGPSWSASNSDVILLSKETMTSFKNDISGGTIDITGSYYRTLAEVMPTANNTEINSKILSLSILNLKSPVKLNPPVTLEFSSEKEYPSSMTYNCSYWNYSIPVKGGWSQEGCTTIIEDDGKVLCRCNHLTNFAVLVSPGPVSKKHQYILSIISLIGCIISIVALLLTILFYVSMWKAVKSHHAVVLLNLCIALLLGNIIFIAGVERTENELICTIIAGLLHYFWLAAFFIMLVEGIQLLLYIIYVFHIRRKRHTAALIFGGWFLPGVIVGASLAITHFEGYGNDKVCWLSVDNGLLWAFVGPVLAIITINFVILLVVLRRATSANIPSGKKKNKLRSAIWNVFVITPLLGVTWVVGVFSVNEDTVFFQYIFAVANSLQGLFIFIFHALCNKKKGRYALREATPSRSKKSQSAQKTSLEQNSNAKSQQSANGNAIHRNVSRSPSANGLPKLDLHSAPSYDINDTYSSGKRYDMYQQLSDGTEVTVVNSQSSVQLKPGADPVSIPVSVPAPIKTPVNDELVRSTGHPPPKEQAPSVTDSLRPSVPVQPNVATPLADSRASQASQPETRRKPEVLNKPKPPPLFGVEPEAGRARVIVAVRPLNPPEIDTTNLMSSPEWPEMVQHLPDDVAQTIISTSRPVSEHHNELLVPPPSDGQRSLSSTPTRIESEMDSLASSFVSLNKNIDQASVARKPEMVDSRLEDAVVPKLANEVEDITSVYELQDKQIEDKDSASTTDDIHDTEIRSVTEEEEEEEELEEAEEEEEEEDDDDGDGDGCDDGDDEGEPEVISCFDPPPVIYPAEDQVRDLQAGDDFDIIHEPSPDYDEDDDDADGGDTDGSEGGDNEQERERSISENEEVSDEEQSDASSIGISVMSIPGKTWEDDQSATDELTETDETKTSDPERNRPTAELDGVQSPDVLVRTRDRNQSGSGPEHEKAIRTSSYLPPMPIDVNDQVDYGDNLEFPPPPSPDDLWPSAAGVESTVVPDRVPLVDEAPLSPPAEYRSPGDIQVREVARVPAQIWIDPKSAVDNRISILSTIPPSPTITTTDISWTSDLSKDTANASVI